MTRPIQLIDEMPYFATYAIFEDKDDKTAAGWLISSGDFKTKYSTVEVDGHTSVKEAPFIFALDGTPRPDSMLSALGYNRFVMEGEPLPEPSHLFAAVSDAISSFVAFDGSFASQKDMSNFLACWVMSTYATSVFDTVGYLWPNGEKGAGKTQCLKTLTALAFMGQSVTSSSSFASIRDEAALGATLGFDDCENLRQMDPQKRELLLAGNTRGSGFMLKEPGKRQDSWETRYLDGFAPRAFTSIGLPDDTLASRTILVPLIRSADTAKTRRKPTNYNDWSSKPDTLRDNMWLAVSRALVEIDAFKADVNKATDLSGRDFDIFQPTLTIAFWLDKLCGVDGLFDRMVSVMESYHATKHRSQLPSFEYLVLQACWNLLKEEAVAKLPTSDIAYGVVEVCRDLDITDETLARPDNQKVGTMLSRLGFQKVAAHGKGRSWRVSRTDLERCARAAGVQLEQTTLSNDEDERAESAVCPFRSAITELNELPW